MATDDLHHREFKRILMIKPSSLGDIVHALPVLHGLRIRYPDAHISWLVGKPFRSLIDHHPELDSVIEFDRRFYGRIFRSVSATTAFVRFVRNLRAKRFDLAIDLQGLFRSAFLAWASGAPTRIGLASTREGASWFYSLRAPPCPDDAHAVDVCYSVARPLGFADVPIVSDLGLSDSERTAAQHRLTSLFNAQAPSFVAVLPGARWETKRWAPSRFAELCDRIRTSLGREVLLLGSNDERKLCEDVGQMCPSAVQSLAGQTSIRELAAILSLADAVVCHDSAPMHLAVALNRPLVAILGPTNPRRTGPYRRIDDVVQLELPCAPCYFRSLRQCPHEHRCMVDLGVDVLFHELQRRLQQNAGCC